MKGLPITAWIIDDEESCSTLLLLKLRNVAPAIIVTGIFSTAIELSKLMDLPDVVFLDIEMPDMDGIRFAKEVSDRAAIIFTTAHAQYGISAVKVQALDYLLKPINDEELSHSITKLEGKVNEKREGLSLLDHPFKNKIAIPTNEAIFIVQVENIISVQALDNCSKFVLEGSKPIVAAKTLKSVTQLLSCYSYFFRSHRSHLANLQYAVRIDPRGESGLLVMKNGEEIEVSREKKRELLMLLHERLLR